MYDDEDVLSALSTARRINAGPSAEMVPVYSTGDMRQGYNPLSALGSMAFGREADTGQQLRHRIAESKEKPTIAGKMLGGLGLDESGERSRTPWLDAAFSTAYMPYRLGESMYDAATAASDMLKGKHPLGAQVYSEEDAPPPAYVAQTDPEILRRGLNFAGTAATLAPGTAFAAGAIPENAAGMFAGRLAKRRPTSCLRKRATR